MPRLFALAFLAGLLCALAGCSSTPQLAIAPVDEPIVVDGSVGEWSGVLRRQDDVPLSLGLRADDDRLYLAMTTRDPALLRQVLGGGLTVWVDTSGGTDRAFGVRYPLGREEVAPIDDEALRGRRTGPLDDEAAARRFEAITRKVLILDQGEDAAGLLRPVDEPSPLEVAADLNAGLLTYELALPLQARDPDVPALRVSPGTTLGLGLTTPDRRAPVRTDRDAERRGRTGGGVTSDPAGRGRTGGAAASGRSAREAEPLNLWIKATLPNSEPAPTAKPTGEEPTVSG